MRIELSGQPIKLGPPAPIVGQCAKAEPEGMSAGKKKAWFVLNRLGGCRD
jgi:hypothetical protein